MAPLSISYCNPHTLIVSPTNPRTHSKKQIGQIATSIRSFGFNNPILLDGSGAIIAGHGRVAAAIDLGMNSVPTVRLAHLSAAQRRAYIIADNKLAELAGWDTGLLAGELEFLLGQNIDFEISDLGFEAPEIDLMLQENRA